MKSKALFLQRRQPCIKSLEIHFKVCILKFLQKAVKLAKKTPQKLTFLQNIFLIPKASIPIAALSLTHMCSLPLH